MEEQLLFPERRVFREWLEENQHNSKGVWLIFSKNTELKNLKAEEALEEALCFGWIDGQLKSLDETKYIKKFTPRKKGSKWSEKNRKTALTLIEQGKMEEKGYAAIEMAKSDNTWENAKAAPIQDEEIDAFGSLIVGHEPAYANFTKMPRSIKATYTMHYLSAKAEETRQKRLLQIIERLHQNKKPM